MNEERVPLSYERPTFRRSLICLLLALVFILAFQVIRFRSESFRQATNSSPSTAKIILAIVIAFLFIVGLLDAFSVVWRRFFGYKLYFDQDNLYVSSNKNEITIRLVDVLAVSPQASGARGNASGIYQPYSIEYNKEGMLARIYLKVYRKKKRNFETFKKRLQEVNPGVKISP